MSISDSDAGVVPALEMAYVLFMDIVVCSKLPMDQHQELLSELQETVRSTRAFAHANNHNNDKLISLPTADGMALVFFDDPQSPARCAVELSRSIRNHPEIKLRMGIHGGPVYRVADINAARNVAGGGINMAQWIMDYGDAGHILVSNTVADVLVQLTRWSNVFQDLGEAEVKQGVRLHIYNLCTDDAGNAELPRKLRTAQRGASAERSRAKRNKLSLIVVAAAVVALGAGGFWYSRQPQKLTDKDTIVLSDFTNTTGDSVFDDTLKQGLAIQLEQSPFLGLISEPKVGDTLKLMGRPTGDRLTPEVTREVCQRTGSKAMLTGSIAGLGNQYLIGLKAVNCNTGDLLGQTQVQAASKEDVPKALGDAAARLRSKLGESLSSVQKYATPLEEATTGSLEALKAYSLGQKMQSASGDSAALPFYKRAVELDPNFAMAYAGMAVVYSNLNEVGRAAENARKAYQLRDKLSERERLSIEANYHFEETGELENAAQVYELWRQIYPRDAAPYTNLGIIYSSLGNWDKALEENREAARLDPNIENNYVNIGIDYASLNRLEEVEAVYKQAEERHLEGEYILANRYQLAFLKEDAAQMTRLTAAAMGKPGWEDWFLAAQADTKAWYGQLKSARELTRRAMDSAQRNDAKETAGAYQALAALREVELGNRETARAEAKAAVKLAPNRNVRAIAALALARAGDPGAEKLAADLDLEFALDTLVQRYWLPTIRAAVALQREDPNRAIELLQVPSAIELGQPANLTISLCPAYLRGEAYLMLHNGNAAAAEFQKFIDHRGVVVNFPWGALARFGLARAYAMQGNTVKARAAYQDVLMLWKDADPDIPILKQARADNYQAQLIARSAARSVAH